jgi:arylsulfatase A-like enzyme
MALRDGRLADVAPTLLALLGLPKPAAMTGETLIVTRDRGKGQAGALVSAGAAAAP